MVEIRTTSPVKNISFLKCIHGGSLSPVKGDSNVLLLLWIAVVPVLTIVRMHTVQPVALSTSFTQGVVHSETFIDFSFSVPKRSNQPVRNAMDDSAFYSSGLPPEQGNSGGSPSHTPVQAPVFSPIVLVVKFENGEHMILWLSPVRKWCVETCQCNSIGDACHG
jgi:hypothetical protein